jgi:hypothetical protein
MTMISTWGRRGKARRPSLAVAVVVAAAAAVVVEVVVEVEVEVEVDTVHVPVCPQTTTTIGQAAV